MKPVNPYPAIPDNCNVPLVERLLARLKNALWQEGWDARKKWEQEPCTEHRVVPVNEYQAANTYRVGDSSSCSQSFFWLHRFQCPECMKELE